MTLSQSLATLVLFALVNPTSTLWPSVENQLRACEANGPLGLITGDVEDWQITASSTYPLNWDQRCQERYARVYQPNGVAWCAKHKSSSEWLQVDLGVPAKVTGLMTQGRADGSEWLTSYMVSYSLDAYHWTYVTDYYGNRRVFDGNVDSYHVKHAYLDEPIIGRYVKFHTVSWNRHPSMRVEIIGCQVCREPIALPPYGKLSASSERHHSTGSSCQAEDAYIITQKGWCPKENNAHQWLQFDVGPPSLVTGVVTRGRGDSRRRQWVTRFLVSYSNDTSVWYFYKDASHLDIKEFGGNSDRNTARYHYFSSPFVARYIRFHPVEWRKHISMRAGLIGCPRYGDCGAGYLRVVPSAPCVENLAFQKSSWINNKRQYKRHIRSQWIRGHASRAVDGDVTVGMHSCTVLDNFYVDRPTWMVDLGERTRVAGVKIVTWQGKEHALRNRDTMMNLERITVFVDNTKGGTRAGRHRRQQRPVPSTTQPPSATTEDDRQLVATDESGGLGQNVCGYISRFNDAIFRPTLHVQCTRPLIGRYVYVEATGVTGRNTRLFNAVLCEVMVYS